MSEPIESPPNPYRRAMISYHVPLRLDMMAQLVLPVQLTEQDGDRLCALIRSLQFPTAEIVAPEAEATAAQRPGEAGSKSASKEDSIDV